MVMVSEDPGVSCRPESGKGSAAPASRRSLWGWGAAMGTCGGLAIGARAEPRFTRDVDLVDVAGDLEAERIARSLQGTGYRTIALLEHDSGRLATVRLASPGDSTNAVVIDLLFASSGVEAEVAASAEQLEYLAGLTIPVAQRGDLIALKVLAHPLARGPARPLDGEPWTWRRRKKPKP